MALGNNRDYKTTDRRARKNLSRHLELMNEIMSMGFAKTQASKLALEIIEGKKTLDDIREDVELLDSMERAEDGFNEAR